MNISLVLDCSNSMQGTRLERVKAAAIAVMRQLKPDDILSIVAFNDRARLIMPASPCSQAQNTEAAVYWLRAEGGTEIYQGLKAAYDEVRRFSAYRSLNHLVLITDGHTYGDEQKCFSLALLAKEQGIGISSLGIGSQWNDTFLDQLCSKTGGSTIYVARDNDIQTFVQRKIRNLSSTYGAALRYDYTTARGVDLKSVFRLQPESLPLPIEGNVLPIGDLPSDQLISLLFEFLVDTTKIDRDELILAEGRIYLSLTPNETRDYSLRLDLRLPVMVGERLKEMPAPLTRAISRLNLYRMQEQAQAEFDKGNVVEATQYLESLAVQLYSQGEVGLARRVLEEVKSLQQSRSLSAEGRKDIKYGTRALLLPAQTEI